MCRLLITRMLSDAYFSLLVDHQMILNAGLSEFFNKCPHSLFSVELTENAKERKYKRVEERDPDDRGFKRHLNDYAASCLLKGDVVMAEDFIKKAIKVDGENMHTWCSKGVLDIEKGELGSAKEAAFKVLELLADDTAACRLRAKLDFAYWNAESVRTEEARDECYQAMKNCLPEAIHIKEMQEYLSYSLLKILVRQLRSEDKHGKPNSWFKERLSLIVSQLIILYQSDVVEYRVDSWIWLTELHSVHVPQKAQKFFDDMLATFCRETGESNISRGACINKAFEMDEKSANSERKNTARIAKNCLECAYHCDDEPYVCNPELQLYWFQKAVDLSEKWIADNYWVIMCSSTAAQGLLHIWAIKFYEENEKLVNDQYWLLYKRKLGKGLLYLYISPFTY